MSDYREKALNEKEERCTECGSTDDVVIHHRDGDRKNDDLDNLVPLCRSCHSKVHSGSDGYEHLTEAILPPRERGTQMSLSLSEELNQDINAVKETSPADTRNDAVRYAVRETADRQMHVREYYELLASARAATTETETEILMRALRFYVAFACDTNTPARFSQLVDRAREEGPLSASSIAQFINGTEGSEITLTLKARRKVGDRETVDFLAGGPDD